MLSANFKPKKAAASRGFLATARLCFISTQNQLSTGTFAIPFSTESHAFSHKFSSLKRLFSQIYMYTSNQFSEQ